jgi:hypothetical protein
VVGLVSEVFDKTTSDFVLVKMPATLSNRHSNLSPPDMCCCRVFLSVYFGVTVACALVIRAFFFSPFSPFSKMMRLRSVRRLFVGRVSIQSRWYVCVRAIILGYNLCRFCNALCIVMGI